MVERVTQSYLSSPMKIPISLILPKFVLCFVPSPILTYRIRKEHCILMGRPRKWTPRRLTTADVVAGAVVLKKYGPDLATNERVRADYLKFCKLNRLTSEEGYEPWIGQMRNSGLSGGTIQTYMEAATQGDKSTSAYVAMKAASALHANSLTGHARDIDLATGVAIIEAAKAKAPGQAQQLWMLLATGQRRVDIHRLHPQSVKIQRKRKLTVKWMWTKGIRKIAHRREVTFPLEGLPDAPPELEQTLMSKKAPFECSVAVLNRCIKKLGYQATTGSFRRLYSDRIEAYCKKNNIPKADMMLHRDDTMDKAFYKWGRQ